MVFHRWRLSAWPAAGPATGRWRSRVQPVQAFATTCRIRPRQALRSRIKGIQAAGALTDVAGVGPSHLPVSRREIPGGSSELPYSDSRHRLVVRYSIHFPWFRYGACASIAVYHHKVQGWHYGKQKKPVHHCLAVRPACTVSECHCRVCVCGPGLLRPWRTLGGCSAACGGVPQFAGVVAGG